MKMDTKLALIVVGGACFLTSIMALAILFTW